eukprot:COSAG01_NODE_1476_length_10188_cov_16.029537_15_plen_180_part_00
MQHDDCALKGQRGTYLVDEMPADGALRSRMPSLVFSSSLPGAPSPAAACGEPSGYLNDAPCPPFYPRHLNNEIAVQGQRARSRSARPLDPCQHSQGGGAACVRAVARECGSGEIGEMGEMGEMGDGGSVGLNLRSAASRAVSPGAAPRNSSYTHTAHAHTEHTHRCIMSACMLGPCGVH